MPDKKDELLKLVQKAIERDKALREQFGIGEKFRFIRDRLEAISKRVEHDLSELKEEEEVKEKPLGEDEVFVYIYLYNAQGVTIPSWQKMLIPSVFYEYSINRPIYADQNDVLSFIRTRTNKLQHGYITIAVKKSDILPKSEEALSKDAIGGQLIRVREGALQAINMRVFTHNDQEYILNSDGMLTKKTNDLATSAPKYS